MTRLLILSLLAFVVAVPGPGAHLAYAQKVDTGTQTSSKIDGGLTSPAGSSATASDTCGQQTGALKNPLKFCNLPDLINAILGAVIELGAILLTLMLVWVGFQFVMARGNPEKVSQARSALLWTIIGGLLLLGATGISAVVQATVGSITP